MRILLLISSLLLTAGSIWIVAKQGISLSSMGPLLFFGGCSLVFIFEKRWDTWIEKFKQKKIESANCKIHEEGFYFPKGYYFRQGFMKNQDNLPFHKIKEIRINTFPISAVTHEKEVIFLQGIKREEVEKTAFAKQLKIVEPVDIWSLICDDFLDTEPDEEERKKIISLLEEQGISKTELGQIRKRIKFRMLLRTYFSWEWIYYGQFDVLHELWPMNKKKYAWTMDIALRNG